MSPGQRLIGIFYRAATGSRRMRNLLTPAGAAFFFGLTTLFVFAALGVDRMLDFPELIPAPLNIAVAVPILAIGLFLMIWSILQFVRVNGTPVPFNPPPKLVTTGPYAHVRNPMLTGVFILLFGLGVLLRSISLVSIFTPLFILFNVWELKAVEERELEKRLGRDYVEYRKRTSMFIPRVKVRTKGSAR